MPTYDYKCNKCGEETEIFHSIMEDPKTLCLACNTSGLERLISKNVSISFKGSGFYITDSKTKASKSSSSSTT